MFKRKKLLVLALGIIAIIIFSLFTFRNPLLPTKTIQDRIQLPADSLLREFKNLPEFGPDTYLVLYVVHPKIDPPLKPEEIGMHTTCPTMRDGQAVEGNYHLAIFDKDKIVSDVLIPGYDYPGDSEATRSGIEKRNNIKMPLNNYLLNMSWLYNWPKPESAHEAETVTVPLLVLDDLNGDSVKNEVLFYGQTFACVKAEGLVAGYTPDKQVHVYSIKTPERMYNWLTGFSPDQTGHATTGWECGDHGASTEEHVKYQFDPIKMMYVQTDFEHKQCY